MVVLETGLDVVHVCEDWGRGGGSSESYGGVRVSDHL